MGNQRFFSLICSAAIEKWGALQEPSPFETEKQRVNTGKLRVLGDLYCVLCFDTGFAKSFGTRRYA